MLHLQILCSLDRCRIRRFDLERSRRLARPSIEVVNAEIVVVAQTVGYNSAELRIKSLGHGWPILL